MASPITLGLYWDKWSPKVQSYAVMDLLQLASRGMCGSDAKIYVWQNPDEPASATSVKDMQSILVAAGLQLATEEDAPPSYWIAYYQTTAADLPDLPTSEFFTKGHRHFKCMTPKKKDLVLKPNSPNYPVLPDRYRLAPPSANPLTRPRPPRNSDTTFLPPWALL